MTMMTATKALIAFCVLAVIGAVLVIGPTELRRLLPGGSPSTEMAAVKPAPMGATTAKPDTKPAATAGATPESKPESRLADSRPADSRLSDSRLSDSRLSESKSAETKPDAPVLAGATPAAPAADAAAKAGVVAETRKQVAAALGDLAPIQPPAAAGDAGPRVDVARIDDRGEAAVIAGRAAPGAKVELLRDGKPVFAATADGSGQFVMTPPQLTAGAYDLTLRATATDGTVTQSSRTMPVAIADATPPSARLAPASAKPAIKPAGPSPDRSDVVAALPSAAARSSERPAPRPRVMALKPAATVASASPAEIFAAPAPQAGASRTIARGDSLWALSRLAYGDGARYAVIFNANRDKIQNPNLIYPGQTFVMPPRAE